MEDRLTDLEIRLTHQEAAIEELTAGMLTRDRELEALRREIARLRQRLSELEHAGHGGEDNHPEPPPPHY